MSPMRMACEAQKCLVLGNLWAEWAFSDRLRPCGKKLIFLGNLTEISSNSLTTHFRGKVDTNVFVQLGPSYPAVVPDLGQRLRVWGYGGLFGKQVLGNDAKTRPPRGLGKSLVGTLAQCASFVKSPDFRSVAQFGRKKIKSPCRPIFLGSGKCLLEFLKFFWGMLQRVKRHSPASARVAPKIPLSAGGKTPKLSTGSYGG